MFALSSREINWFMSSVDLDVQLFQYNLNGLGWNARTIPGNEPSPLCRRIFSEDGDVTDNTKHSAGKDIDADSDNDVLISDCWLITI